MRPVNPLGALRGGWRRAVSAAAAAALAGTTLAPGAASAQTASPADPSNPSRSIAIPTDPDNPYVSGQWANSDIRDGEGERATVELVNGPEVIGAHDPVQVTLRITNTSGETLEGLSVTPRRGPATGSLWDQRVAAVADLGEYSVVGRTRNVDKHLAPGESTDVALQVLEDELPLPGLSTYPLMFVLAEDGAVLDTERFHLSVRGAGEGRAPGLSALYPVSAPVDIVPGETGEAPDTPPLILSSENLADQLAPDGRLSRLVDVYSAATTQPAVAQASCMSLDPALVDTVARMARGYTVSQTRPDVVEEPKRLRDSWGTQDDTPAGSPGRGSEDARKWLDKVGDIASSGCVVAMPWANADLNAVARTGDVWLMREAVERGPSTLARVLGQAGVANAVVAPSGYLGPGAAAGMGWADRANAAGAGLDGAWEEAQLAAGQGASGRLEGEGRATLERPDLPGVGGVAAPAPASTVRVLVASNTVRHDPVGQRFSWVAPGVQAVEYQDSLASTLAAVGPHPETTGYSAEGLRYNLTDDSTRARAVNAASAVRLAAQQARGAGGEEEPAPILVNPPAAWDPDSAATVMRAVGDTLADSARPMTLDAYLTAPADARIPPAEWTGTPNADPTVYADSEVLTAGQQARFANDLSALLVADPAIALTRYGFTLPLRRDLLVSLSSTGRRAKDSYRDAEEATRSRLAGSRDMMNGLRSSVALIPPGNVYTRASASSPLLIVAENGLPLPVDSTILYTGPEGARLNVPGDLRIPAHGSVTVQMTADLPDNRDTDLQLFLASPQKVPISQPVDISVRTAGFALRGWAFIAALAVFLALLLLFGVGRHRRARGPTRPAPTQAPPDSAADPSDEPRGSATR